MRLIMLFLALTVALTAAPQSTMPLITVKQKVVKPRVPKGRKSKVKGHKAPKVRRRTR